MTCNSNNYNQLLMKMKNPYILYLFPQPLVDEQEESIDPQSLSVEILDTLVLNNFMLSS